MRTPISIRQQLTYHVGAIYRNRETADKMETPRSLPTTICTRWLEIRKKRSTARSTPSSSGHGEEVIKVCDVFVVEVAMLQKRASEGV